MFDTITRAWTSLRKPASLSQREVILSTIACTMAGVVIGMLISPRKTVTLFSHNGSNNISPQSPEPAEHPAARD